MDGGNASAYRPPGFTAAQQYNVLHTANPFAAVEALLAARSRGLYSLGRARSVVCTHGTRVPPGSIPQVTVMTRTLRFSPGQGSPTLYEQRPPRLCLFLPWTSEGPAANASGDRDAMSVSVAVLLEGWLRKRRMDGRRQCTPGRGKEEKRFPLDRPVGGGKGRRFLQRFLATMRESTRETDSRSLFDLARGRPQGGHHLVSGTWTRPERTGDSGLYESTVRSIGQVATAEGSGAMSRRLWRRRVRRTRQLVGPAYDCLGTEGGSEHRVRRQAASPTAFVRLIIPRTAWGANRLTFSKTAIVNASNSTTSKGCGRRARYRCRTDLFPAHTLATRASRRWGYLANNPTGIAAVEAVGVLAGQVKAFGFWFGLYRAALYMSAARWPTRFWSVTQYVLPARDSPSPR